MGEERDRFKEGLRGGSGNKKGLDEGGRERSWEPAIRPLDITI